MSSSSLGTWKAIHTTRVKWLEPRVNKDSSWVTLVAQCLTSLCKVRTHIHSYQIGGKTPQLMG